MPTPVGNKRADQALKCMARKGVPKSHWKSLDTDKALVKRVKTLDSENKKYKKVFKQLGVEPSKITNPSELVAAIQKTLYPALAEIGLHCIDVLKKTDNPYVCAKFLAFLAKTALDNKELADIEQTVQNIIYFGEYAGVDP